MNDKVLKPAKTGQEMQDEIFRNMSAEDKLKLVGQFSSFIMRLYKISGFDREKFKALVEHFDSELHKVDEHMKFKGYFPSPYGLKNENMLRALASHQNHGK